MPQQAQTVPATTLHEALGAAFTALMAEWDGRGVDATKSAGFLLGDLIKTAGAVFEDAVRAELTLARSLRLEWPSIRAAINPDVHTGARAVAYLKSRNWVLDYQRNAGEIWHDQPDSHGRGHYVFVPFDREYDDWREKMAALVRDLASFLGTGELQVLADIAEAGNA